MFYIAIKPLSPTNSAETCDKYQGNYSLATEYIFVDDLKEGIRGKVDKDGATWKAECALDSYGNFLLKGRDETVHSLEVRLKDSTKYIHARKFISKYESVVTIDESGKLSGRRIVGGRISTEPIIEDQSDFEKNQELTDQEKAHINQQIKIYEKIRDKNRKDLVRKSCFITTGKDGGDDIIGFTCLDSYTRVMRRNPA